MKYILPSLPIYFLRIRIIISISPTREVKLGDSTNWPMFVKHQSEEAGT